MVSVGANNNLGAATGIISFNGDKLQLTDSFSNNRAVTLGQNGGTVETAAGKSNTFSGKITGAGKLTKAGDGTLILMGASTYNGGTEVSDGILQIGDGGMAGQIQGNVTIDTGATLAFKRSDEVTYSNLVSGAGGLRQDGTGTVISAGTSGSITGDVTNNATLAFNRSNSFDFLGAISGSGTLNQIGSGGLTPSGNSSAFTGAINVNAGSLLSVVP